MKYLLLLFLSGCGGITYHIHDNPLSTENLNPISINKGEDIVIIDYKKGLMFGDISPGLISSNPEVAEVIQIKKGLETITIIHGKKAGFASIYYTEVTPPLNIYNRRPSVDTLVNTSKRKGVFNFTVKPLPVKKNDCAFNDSLVSQQAMLVSGELRIQKRTVVTLNSSSDNPNYINNKIALACKEYPCYKIMPSFYLGKGESIEFSSSVTLGLSCESF